MTIDDATLAELQAKYDELYEITAGGEALYVKMPSQEAYRAFKAQVMDEKKRVYAADNVLRSCVVHPDVKTLNELLSRRPFLTEAFASQLLELAGMNQQVEAKKL
jgi:hypothetical protein